MELQVHPENSHGDLNMQPALHAHLAFHLTGKRAPGELDSLDEAGLRPALLAGYSNLSKLRYDFPLVLVLGGDGVSAVQSLSGLFDDALRQMAVVDDGGSLRKQARRLELEIRSLAARRDGALLSELFEAAASGLTTQDDDRLQDNFNRLRAALAVDGIVVDCDSAMPARLLRHAWQTVHESKARIFGERINGLITKLTDILRADTARSDEARSADSLMASVGATQQADFDFAALSRLLVEALPQTSLPESRRDRIQWLVSVLSAQQFFPKSPGGDKTVRTAEPGRLIFDNCADALAAYAEQLPKAVELSKAVAMAEREIEGEYIEASHDAVFAEFGLEGLDPRDLDLFPDYLICVRASQMRAEESDQILDALAAGLRAKVLVETDDILEPSRVAGGDLTFNWRSKQLATTAMGLNTFYVLQSSSSHLFQLRDQIFRGMACSGPALFSVFSAAARTNPDQPPYLTAAAAMEARIFPAFTYDPLAGSDWASQFQLEGNPQLDCDWPVQSIDYMDEEHQRISEELAFTLVDFVAHDPRYAKHFARVPRSKWADHMVPLAKFLSSQSNGISEQVPYLLVTDSNNMLHKVIVDEKMIREARRCTRMWHSLQELGGIHNSHAARLVAEERKAWEVQLREQGQTTEVSDKSAPAEAAIAVDAPEPAAAPEPVEEPEEPEKQTDEPYIETLRCTTCNECTEINGKMFAYNENKQAFIADPDAGTYRQLVEAAESCQVAIIHPGKPRNPKEAALDDLMKRAEAFV